jgi:sensor c-di-GMP phosphodiesterase-like protein
VAIVTALVGLARSLDLALVAEGVETEAQRTLLREMGCEHIQGWLMSKALPADELARGFASQALRMHCEEQGNGTALRSRSSGLGSYAFNHTPSQ